MKILESSTNVLNLRIRMPITNIVNKRNFITKITTYENICSISNSMTVLPELLPYVLDMMKKEIKGTINLTNPGLISHNEILEMFKEIVDPNFVWNNFSSDEQKNILTSDRSNNYLDTTKLLKLYPKIKNIKESVRDILISYKQSYHQYTNLLVTGGCGFIGSHFINLIGCKNIYNIINIDAMYYCSNENNVDEIIRKSDRYKLIKGNINELDLLSILKKYRITHLIHFAAQSHVQNSFEDSLIYTQDNIVATHNLLESSRKYGKLNKFIHVSTDEVYGESMLNFDEEHKTEHSILCPTNPYAGTKAGAELLVQSYNHSFGLPIIITRGNNVYGPNQYPEKVVPKFIKLLQNNQPITIQGDGSCVRAFLHSYDTATAFETILTKGKIGEIYNIGCDKGMEYDILTVAKMIISNIKDIKNDIDYNKWINYIEDRPFNDKRYYISNKKLKDLGWKITIKFDKGLKKLCKIN
jgi:dTDP-glucose 4,6-dehydratase